MAHKTLISGTAYSVTGGRELSPDAAVHLGICRKMELPIREVARPVAAVPAE